MKTKEYLIKGRRPVWETIDDFMKDWIGKILKPVGSRKKAETEIYIEAGVILQKKDEIGIVRLMVYQHYFMLFNVRSCLYIWLVSE